MNESKQGPVGGAYMNPLSNLALKSSSSAEKTSRMEKSASSMFLDDGFEWVEEYLNSWARYMREDDSRLGPPKKAAGFVSGGLGGYREKIAEEWQAEIDDRAINIIEAALEDLTPAEQCAVHHIKLDAVYRFHREPAVDIYLRARQKIGAKLKANNFQ